jgi:plastocyanin
MKTAFYTGSVAIAAIMMILIMASISGPALLFTQTAIASIDEQDYSARNDTDMTIITTTGITTPTAPDNATQRVAVGGGNITISINQFSPQTAEIQPGESVTFFAPNGSTEVHNVIFDLSNGTIISDIGVPFTLPLDILGGEVPTDVSEELLPAPPYNLGEPIIQNTTDGTTQAIIGFNKIAFYPAVVDQNDNVIYLEEEELRRQMEESMQQGMFMPANLSTSYTMDGTERVVSSGIMLDVSGFAAIEEEGGVGPQQEEGVQEQQQQQQAPTPEGVEEFPPPAYPILSSFTVTFEQLGTYGYFCAFHPGMFGQIVVGGGEEETSQISSTATTTPSMTQPLT